MEELITEVWHEIAAKPVVFAVEIAQFAILVFIIKAVAFGIGKRKGMVTNMLAERRERILAELAEADAGQEALQNAAERVSEIQHRADAIARSILREARANAREQKRAILAEGESRAAEIVVEAHEALAKEQADMLEGIRDQLVDVVTASTHQVLEQGLSPAEQRAVVQRAIIAGIEDLDSLALSS
ncbi:MAG: hypothetical protein EG823_04765 [Actinobacteria bacterium]|nr:hypothetical protein [Actinomycetota bacterium]